MNWKLIKKSKETQPSGNDYSLWKEQIAKECYNQCVYCSIHEEPWGGINNYHIEHYRPKSKYKDLELDICNLFYACPICNRFKSDDWPADPTNELDNASYPDPSRVDYSAIFELNESTFIITGHKVASSYIIERLYLNRPQLVYERREQRLRETEKKLRNEVVALALKVSDVELLAQTMIVVNRLIDLLHKRQIVRPYKQSEIKKIDK